MYALRMSDVNKEATYLLKLTDTCRLISKATITSNEGRVICIAAMHNLALFMYPAYKGLRRLSARNTLGLHYHAAHNC